MIRTLASLEPGQTGIVSELDLPEEVAGKLLELGIGPGESLRLIRRAPAGDPIEIEVLGYRLAIRRREARGILLQ
jgi:ferrous iron transport protein A